MDAMLATRATDETIATDDTDVLAATRAIAGGPLKAAAGRIDAGEYSLDIMATLGEAGALGLHLTRNGSKLDAAITAIHEVSRYCGSTGFLMWAHAVCGIYLERAANPVLSRDLLETHATGRSFGGTALSNPMKAIAGIEPMLFRARQAAGGYVVSGSLPWVSHIRSGQYCGAMAGVVDAGGTVVREILFLLRCDDRVTLKPCPHFSGMEGTSTWGIKLDDYFIGDDAIIADPARPLIARIKAPFILLQCGMATGVAQGSIDSMLEVEPVLGHVNRFLDERPDALQRELDELVARVDELAAHADDDSNAYMIDVLDARAHGAELALRASQSALLHQGARGYLMSAAPQRRIREAHFTAIVTPAIKHLRWEMARLSEEVSPA